MVHMISARLGARVTFCVIGWMAASGQSAPVDPPHAAKVTVVTSFGPRIGGQPNAVIVSEDGSFYGTSLGGDQGFSSIFRVARDGTKHLLHTFDGTDGRFVESGLLQASDGALYGSAVGGGAGWGTVFRITEDGAFTVLHTMKGDETEGSGSPYPLIQSHDGSLYGASMKADDRSAGALYRISPSGDFSVVAAFLLDLIWPSGSPLEGDDGNFYLTMNAGGAHNGGGLLSVTPSGVVTKLADFPEGDWPVGGLTYDATHQAMYGVTSGGNVYRYSNGQVQNFGSLNGCGVSTRPTLGPDGTHFYIACGLHVDAFTADGDFSTVAATPGPSFQGLAIDAKGALYGTTSYGGVRDLGTMFRITRY